VGRSATCTLAGRAQIIPLHEGASYLGFIFARGRTPEFAEQALRQAHRELRIIATPGFPVV